MTLCESEVVDRVGYSHRTSGVIFYPKAGRTGRQRIVSEERGRAVVSCRHGKAIRGSRCFGLQDVRRLVWLAACLWMLVDSLETTGQELEPRAYSPSPTGANFLVVGFGELSGSVLFDPTLRISNVSANLRAPVEDVTVKISAERR